MYTPTELSNERMAQIHHRFYPHTSAEQFYQNIVADMAHLNESLRQMGFTSSDIRGFTEEAAKLFVLDKKTHADMKQREKAACVRTETALPLPSQT